MDGTRYAFTYTRSERIVAMLTRMIERGHQIREGEAVVYGYVYGYVNDGEPGQAGRGE